MLELEYIVKEAIKNSHNKKQIKLINDIKKNLNECFKLNDDGWYYSKYNSLELRIKVKSKHIVIVLEDKDVSKGTNYLLIKYISFDVKKTSTSFLLEIKNLIEKNLIEKIDNGYII